MGSLQQQGGGQVNSNRIVSVAETPPPGGEWPAGSKEYDEEVQQKPGWKKFLTHVGPGFLVSLAYLDPGNLETDLQAGANHGYELLWVILIGLIFALIIQSLAARIIVFSWALGLAIGINIYYLTTIFIRCLIHNSLPKVGNVFIEILIFPLMGVYIISIIYLMLRKDKVATFVINRYEMNE